MPYMMSVAAMGVDAEANALARLMDGGYLRIYGGRMPDTPEEPVGDRRMAVELRLSSPAFGPASDGIVIAGDLAPGVAVADVNPVTWARITQADGQTAVVDISVGTTDAVLRLPTANIPRGATVSCSFFSLMVRRKSGQEVV